MSTSYQIMQSVKSVNYLTSLVALTDLCVGVKTFDKERLAIGAVFVALSMLIAEARHAYSDLTTSTLRGRLTLLRIETPYTLRVYALFALTVTCAFSLGSVETIRGTFEDKPDRAFLGFGCLGLTVLSFLPICKKSTSAQMARTPTLTRSHRSHLTHDVSSLPASGEPALGHQAVIVLRAVRVRRAMEPRYVDSSLPSFSEVRDGK